MGCDIHLIAERRDNADAPWRLVKGVGYDHRNYDVFAVLADVRNGRGFAGVETGDRFNPIAPQRGIPDDLGEDTQKHVRGLHFATCGAMGSADDDGDGDGPLIGDHSFSWLTLAEMLAFDWTQVHESTGIVSMRVFERWNRIKKWDPVPESYCGGISGSGIRIIEPAEAEAIVAEITAQAGGRYGLKAAEFERLFNERFPEDDFGERDRPHVRVRWQQTYAQDCATVWTELIPALLRLGRPENVRIVFGFDS